MLPRGEIIDRYIYASDVKLLSSQPVYDRSNIICFRCGEKNGHVKSECLHWKTRICWHFTNGQCTKPMCPFAHGYSELRTPWDIKCVRIIKTEQGCIDMGCGSSLHSYRNCPHAENIATSDIAAARTQMRTQRTFASKSSQTIN